MFCHFVLITKTTQPGPQVLSINSQVLELTSLFIYRTLLGKQWLVTTNYPRGFEPIRNEKYFEEIIIPYLYHTFIITPVTDWSRLNAEYFFSATAEDPARKLWLKREHGTGGQRDLSENGGEGAINRGGGLIMLEDMKYHPLWNSSKRKILIGINANRLLSATYHLTGMYQNLLSLIWNRTF